MKKFVTNKKGFTIIELLIASVIISTGLLTVVSMIFNAFGSTVPLSDNLTASYLTQEGFEIIRRIRDTNFNKRYTGEEEGDYRWLDGLIEEGDTSATGGIDYQSTELEGGKDGENLYIEDSGLYGYDGSGDAQETTFQREINIERKCYDGYYDDDFEDDYCEEDGEAEYILVNVEVRWKQKGEDRSYEAETKLFNWY